jgi:hydroxypyruvate isomerase
MLPMVQRINRRQAIAAGTISMVGLRSHALLAAHSESLADGSMKQSICRWCYNGVPLEKLCGEAQRIGYSSIELLTPAEVKTVAAQGLTCAVLMGGPSVTISKGFNRTENHDQHVKELTEAINFAADAQVPNVICFSGNRQGMSDDEGLKNCAAGLKRIVGHAESKKVTLLMELLNSKIDHKDYMCDRTPWGVKLVKSVGSPRFKLLYDIYHMQIMEGDVIRTINQYKDFIGHYHTGGVPGRNEIDATQELYYPAIAKAIRDTGYTGYLGQEFIPKREPMKSLADAFAICQSSQ